MLIGLSYEHEVGDCEVWKMCCDTATSMIIYTIRSCGILYIRLASRYLVI